MSIDDATRLKREILLRSMFPSMPVAAHLRFIELLEDVEATRGELVFDVGESPDRFLFLIEGRIAMEAEGQHPGEFAPPAVIGVIDTILERPRTRNCRALEPSRLLSIRSSDWFDMLEDNGQIARAGGREQDVMLESTEQIFGREHFHPRGRQLQGERQRIEPSANRCHGGTVRRGEAKVRSDVPNALHEQPHRRSAGQIGGRRRFRVHFQREGADGVLPLAAHTERRAAGGQQLERGD